MARRGRRPGDQGTRDAILTAARATFLADGFTRATITGIARRAGVDAALVYHYFQTKVDLFLEAIAALPYPPGPPAAAASGAPPRRGSDIITDFLRRWEQDDAPHGRAFLALAQAVSSSPEAAAALQHFIAERVWRNLPPADAPQGGEPARGAALVGTQLLGIAWTRYVLRLEPVASAPIEQVAAWFGAAIDAVRDPAPGS